MGTTRVVAIIGSPVRHSLSPAIHNAAFRALDLDWVYVALEVDPREGEEAVAAMRILGLAGLSVTMPHKETVVAAVDRVTPVVAELGAANTIYWDGDAVVADNTDGPGFLDALRIDEGFDPRGCHCVVIGAGGAARALVLALAGAEAGAITIVNRTRSRAETAAALAPGVASVGSDADVRDVDLVVNATPLGMAGEGPVVAGEFLHAGQLVIDLVYHPPVTPLVAVARDRGAAAVNGVGMLIHQAAHQFRRWTGEEPPLEVMSAAALAELSRR
jgi:shikimate dehydrogenase